MHDTGGARDALGAALGPDGHYREKEEEGKVACWRVIYRRAPWWFFFFEKMQVQVFADIGGPYRTAVRTRGDRFVPTIQAEGLMI